MKKVYSPGCALLIYKPELARKISDTLNRDNAVPNHTVCCRHAPGLDRGTQVVNTCAGCDRRFRELYEGVTTVSLWEVLARDEVFNFPDYGGRKMSVHDACPTRTEERVHDAVRVLLKRMNIEIVEPEQTRTKAFCCGDSCYGSLPLEKVKERMKVRADTMPCEEVVVYCISCVKSMHIGGKKPRYLADLLFGEETLPGECEPDTWHSQLQAFIDAH